MNARVGLARWHDMMAGTRDEQAIAALVREDAVFHSPVVHTPQSGRQLVAGYLTAATRTLGNADFRYVRELADGDTVLLEFETAIDGVHINGIDLIRFDEAGLIVDFKVMIRPLKAVNKVWEVMAGELTRPPT